jgi:preprotein translocase subunit SecE
MFSIYKSGQGYWTRLGSALGATLIITFTAAWLWAQIPAWFSNIATRENLVFYRLGIILPVMLGLGLFSWWLMNKPSRAEFLIETDNEMKRINWASRKELVGSTRVVIFFMLSCALVLFFYDQIFHMIFWLLSVLKTPPLGF